MTKPIRTPHPPLTDYYADEQARRGFVRTIFDSTASDYDRIDRLLAFGSGPWYRNQALQRAGLKPGMRVVDIGVGTGLVAREAVKLTGDPALVVGVDPSIGMMSQAHLPGVQLVEGRAEAIPFPDASFDFLSMGYALRHIGDLSAAFSEFHRVLKPGGRLCLLEITKPERAWSQALLKVYMRGIVPVIARLAGSSAESAKLWRYYWDTIEACVPPSGVIDALSEAGFVGAKRHIETGALSILAEFQAVKAG
jgi:demethylmenaquinone methyltransferase/2-methoxy-6-polyprenyl-1,4-benzoquinol methylase